MHEKSFSDDSAVLSSLQVDDTWIGTTDILLVSDELWERIARWRADPMYGEMPYEALYPGGDPEDLPVSIWPVRDIDAALTPPRVSVIVDEPDGERRGILLERYQPYQRHVQQMHGLWLQGYSTLLEALERTTKPRKTAPPTYSENMLRWDWTYTLPQYVSEFRRRTQALLDSAAEDDRALGRRGRRCVDQLSFARPCKRRGRPSLHRVASLPNSIVSELRTDAERLRPRVKLLSRDFRDDADSSALMQLFSEELSCGGPSITKRVTRLLRQPKRPQYILNQLLAWKYGLRPADVQRVIARSAMPGASGNAL